MIIDRLKQGSTYAGIAAIISALKFLVPPQYGGIADGLVMLFGGVAVAVNK